MLLALGQIRFSPKSDHAPGLGCSRFPVQGKAAEGFFLCDFAGAVLGAAASSQASWLFGFILAEVYVLSENVPCDNVITHGYYTLLRERLSRETDSFSPRAFSFCQFLQKKLAEELVLVLRGEREVFADRLSVSLLDSPAVDQERRSRVVLDQEVIRRNLHECTDAEQRGQPAGKSLRIEQLVDAEPIIRFADFQEAVQRLHLIHCQL